MNTFFENTLYTLCIIVIALVIMLVPGLVISLFFPYLIFKIILTLLSLYVAFLICKRYRSNNVGTTGILKLLMLSVVILVFVILFQTFAFNNCNYSQNIPQKSFLTAVHFYLFPLSDPLDVARCFVVEGPM